jgi:hypothetical protein
MHSFYLNKSQSKTVSARKCTINDLNYLSFNKRLIKSDGMDHRYNESDIDHDLIQRIRENFEKYETLKYLENDRISILDKLRKIRESGINPPNLNAGGLMKDWDFV